MSEVLYPLKFEPILKSKIWGGQKLKNLFGKKSGKLSNIGESWEISCFNGDISVVSNGFLKGNALDELIEIYMGDLIGDRIFDEFGIQFPLLIKLIEAEDDLSIQVHPDDEIAEQRHNSFGKTEMWYVIQADNGSELISGFRKESGKEEYIEAINKGEIKDLLNSVEVFEGDLFFIPAGRVHAIGKGILLAEIQQTSDLTYRIYDWGRLDHQGNPRELHTEMALDVIDYSATKNCKTDYNKIQNHTVNTIKCKYFSTNILKFDKEIEKDYILIDSFIIYLCTKGRFSIVYNQNESITVDEGETVLIPAALKNLILIPEKAAEILEVYVPEI
jgi:mannose-6-phosphate isomerase